MRPNLDTVLDECLAALRNGASVAACLTRYPEHADELSPLLATVREVGQVLTPPSSAAARAAGKQQMLSALAAKGAQRAGTPALLLGLRQLSATLVGGIRPAWNLAAVVAAVLLVATSGVAVASSADALPGDVLYPVKLASQKAQLALTLNPARQELVANRFSSQQRNDVEAVLASGRQTTVEFEGVLQRMDENLWVVGGLTVTLQESTTISGDPFLGMVVRVRGELPGDGTLQATELTVDSSSTPWATAPAEPTDTVGPTAPVESAETAEPTETPEPASTEDAADTPEPTETAEPKETAEPEETLDVVEQESLRDLPRPSETPQTAEPTETPDLDDEAAETPEADDSELEETDEPDDDGADSTPEPDDDSDSDDDSNSGRGSGSDDNSDSDDDSNSGRGSSSDDDSDSDDDSNSGSGSGSDDDSDSDDDSGSDDDSDPGDEHDDD